MQRKIETTTLGELVATVTEEVEQAIGKNVVTNMLVSQILNSLLRENKIRLVKSSSLRF